MWGRLRVFWHNWLAEGNSDDFILESHLNLIFLDINLGLLGKLGVAANHFESHEDMACILEPVVLWVQVGLCLDNWNWKWNWSTCLHWYLLWLISLTTCCLFQKCEVLDVPHKCAIFSFHLHSGLVLLIQGLAFLHLFIISHLLLNLSPDFVCLH